MRTIMLVDERCEAFKVAGVLFQLKVPKTVEDDVADVALASGRFTDAIDPRSVLNDLASFGIGAMVPEDGYVVAPKNVIGKDDLNGKRVLIRRPGGIGDNVFAAILAQHIKNKYPSCSITLGTSPGLVDFMRSFDAFSSVMSADQSCAVDVTHAHEYVISLGYTLGSEDTARIDDEDYFRSHWDRAGITEALPSPFPVPQIMNAISNFAIQEAATSVLNESGFGEEEYCVLLLGTSNPLKRLRPEQLRDIANAMSSPGVEKTGNPRIRVLALGSDNDRVFQTKSSWISIQSGLPLPVCVELMRRSRLVIGCDTGLLQLAGALQIPTVSLWGPTDPALSMQHYEGKKEIITAEHRLECAPCRQLRVSHCPFYSNYAKCMTETPLDAVRSAATKLLNEAPTHPMKEITTEAALSHKRAFSSSYRVAVLLDYGAQYTGGGFYTWEVAKAIATLPKVSVTVFTDAAQAGFVYTRGDKLVESSRLSVVYNYDLKGWDSPLAFDAVIGNPPNTGVDAVTYSGKNGAKPVLLVYETPNYIRQFRKGLDSQDKYWEKYKKALRSASQIWCISSTVKAALFEWIPSLRKKKNVHVIVPTINDAVADAALASGDVDFYTHKQNLIVMIARNEKYKDLAEALHVAATLPIKGLRVAVIGEGVSKLTKKSVAGAKATIETYEGLAEVDKWELLRSAKVVLHSSTFEGFGIPVAEGLYAGARVISRKLPPIEMYFDDHVTYYTDDKSLTTALKNAFAAWDTLDELEEDIDDQPGEHNNAKFRHVVVAEDFTSASMRKRLATVLKDWVNASDEVEEESIPGRVALNGTSTGLRVAYVSPWNTQCGIAETTKTIAERINSVYRAFSYTDIPTIYKDGPEVDRCWDRRFNDYETVLGRILEFEPNVVHIEHEHSLFQNEGNLFAFIQALRSRGISVVVTLHTYLASKFIDDLGGMVDALIVTKPQDEATEKLHVVPLPVSGGRTIARGVARQAIGVSEADFLVGSFGMWQVHKGFKELLATYNAVSERVPGKTRYLISGAAAPKSQYFQEVRREHFGLSKAGSVLLYDDYPPVDDVVTRLAACDVLVFNYSVAHHSSSSAAIRTAFAAHRPIVCTESPMFSEFEDGKHVLKVPYTDAGALVDAIVRLHGDKELGSRLVQACDEYCESCSPNEIARMHDDLYMQLVYAAV